MKAEEEHLRHEQEMEIAQKREAATQLAKERGLTSSDVRLSENIETKPPENELVVQDDQPAVQNASPRRSSVSEIEQRLGLASPTSILADSNPESETEPFPSFPTTPVKETNDFGQPP